MSMLSASEARAIRDNVSPDHLVCGGKRFYRDCTGSEAGDIAMTEQRIREEAGDLAYYYINKICPHSRAIMRICRRHGYSVRKEGQSIIIDWREKQYNNYTEPRNNCTIL